jgi:hypothetical protein
MAARRRRVVGMVRPRILARLALLVCGGLAATAVRAAAQSYSLSNPAPADKLRDLCPDRPSKGTGPCTVDAGHWQVESDLTNYTFQRDAGVSTRTWLVTSPALKLGLTDTVDAEIAFTPDVVVRTTDHTSGVTQNLSGFGDTYLRLKVQVAGSGGGGFQAALLPYVKAPTARSGIGNGAWESGLLVPVQWNLPKGWQLGLTPEADMLKDASGSGYHLAVSTPVGLSHEIAPKVTGTVELWSGSDFDPGGATHQWSFDLATAWLARPDLQLDAGVNFGLNRATPGVQAYVGVTRRF